MRSRHYAPVEPSQVYPLFTWVLGLFVGAAFNVVLLTSLAYILASLAWPVNVYWVLTALLVGFVMLPIFLASLMTELEPTRIIMPPAYIQALTAGWFLAIVPLGSLNWFFPSSGLAIVFVLFAVLGAAVDDLLTPSTLGYAFGSGKLPVRCLVAHASIADVQERIMILDHRQTIGLQKNPVETEQGVLLRTDKSEPTQLLVMLCTGEHDNETKIVITAFSKEQYQVTAPKAANELVREKSLYITAILTKPEEVAAKAITVTEEKDENRLVKEGVLISSFILNNEVIGIFEKISRVSANAWARIALFGISYVAPLWFYLNHDTANAIGTFVSITVTLAILSGVQLFKRKTG
jgi:predicted outer membrane lipoprotein